MSGRPLLNNERINRKVARQTGVETTYAQWLVWYSPLGRFIERVHASII